MRNRRLLIVLVVFVVLLALGGGAVFLRYQTLNQRALKSRAKGIEAAKAGDYVTALDQVGRYLQRFGQEDDAEALYAYAQARERVPLPNGRHVIDAIGVYRRTLVVEPEHKDAQKALLDLYVALGYGQETKDLAGRILERDPDNAHALHCRGVAHARLREFEDALKDIRRAAELAPESVEDHALAMSLMMQLSRPAEEVLAYPDEQSGLDPEKAPYRLIKAISYDVTRGQTGTAPQDGDPALEWAERAAEVLPHDAKLVTATCELFDRLHRYDSSLKLLTRIADESGDPEFERMLVRRLYESGDMHGVMERTSKVALEDQDSTLLALRAIGLANQTDLDGVRAITAELEGRADDNVAKAWAPLLKALFIEKSSPQQVVAACQEALSRDPDNPRFHYFLGVAQAQMGESDLALRAWEEAHRLARAWVDPILRSAEILASKRRYNEANILAINAVERAPQNVSVAVTVAGILGANLGGLPAADGPSGAFSQQRLLELVEKIQTVVPGEARTLPLYIDLLARLRSPQEAQDKLQTALNAEKPLPESALLQLARVSEARGLGLEEACLKQVANTEGATAAQAYARAMAAHQMGDSARGRQMLEEEARLAGNTVEWLAALAQYLEAIGAEDATQAWAAVSDAAPSTASVQQRVLGSKAAWQDTALIGRAIDRVKETTGNEGVAWRAARARWLLMTDTSTKAAAEASSLMTEVLRTATPSAEYYTTMALALERLGNLDGALDNFTKASQVDPQSNALRFELARLHQARGEALKAEEHLEYLARSPNLTPNDARRLASLLAEHGQIDRAIPFAIAALPPEQREAPADLFLADLYRRSGKLTEAEAVVQRLLQTEADARTVAFAADLLAWQGRMDEARAVLARLDGMELEKGQRELVLADFERSHGAAEEAKRLYEAALAANPGNSVAWRRCIDLTMRAGDAERAVAMVSEAHAACPDDEMFAELAGNSELLKVAAGRPIAQPLFLAALQASGRQAEAIESLQVISEAPEGDRERWEQLAVDLRQLSDRYPLFLPLKLQLARLYRQLGRHTEAAQLATQTMHSFPDEAEPARLAAETLSVLGQWQDALRAGEEWRRRSPLRTTEPDVLISQALVMLRRPDEALARLEPHLQSAEAQGAEFSPVAFMYARALVAAGRVEEAGSLIAPRLGTSDQWRMAWAQLSAGIADPAAAAAWLERVEPRAPKDSLDETLTFGVAWFELAKRSGDAAQLARARATLQAVKELPDVTGNALLALAVVEDASQDFAAAEADYRKALELDPNLLVAKNNLAMILINRRENLDEALKLAEEAVAAEPGNASFIDTLGSACAARGDYDAAIKHLEHAVELEPAEEMWRKRLAELQQEKAQAAPATPAAATSAG